MHIAVSVDVAGLGVGALHPLGLPLIDHRAEVAEAVEITGGGHNGVDGFRHFRGQVLGIGAVGAVRQMAAELGGIGHFDLGEGVDGIIVNLLPGHGKDAFVQIVANAAVLIDLPVGLKIGLLPVQNPLGLFQNWLHFRRAVHLPIAGRIGLGGHQRVVGDGVVLADRLRLFLGRLRLLREAQMAHLQAAVRQRYGFLNVGVKAIQRPHVLNIRYRSGLGPAHGFHHVHKQLPRGKGAHRYQNHR